jgi:hypothetical protein
MRKLLYVLVFLSLVLSACGQVPVASAPVPSETPVASVPDIAQPPTGTPLPQPSPISPTPTAGFGPSGFPTGVNPLTGLQVADPTLLDRRPLLIKISNLPRSIRPQYGLSLADLVFEYYTEEGATRFAALFYGNNADTVGPIRSARFMDAHLIRGYKAVFAFALAYQKVLDRLYGSDFANRLVIGGPNSPLYIVDPNRMNLLMANTATLSAYITAQGVENGRQNLDGMSFNPTAPAGGQSVTQLFVRYSGVIYNRWDYDPSTGKYLRFSDIENDYNNNNEQYVQSVDHANGQPLAFDNVVVLYVNHEVYNAIPEVVDIQFVGSGTAYAFRDGQAYQLTWQRNDPNAVVSLANLDGTPFPFKPGTTWFEVVGSRSEVQQTGQSWRIVHLKP